MESEWHTRKIKQFALPRGISYGIVQPGKHDPNGVPITRVSDLVDGRIEAAEPLKVAPSIEANYARTRLDGGEILVSLVGSLGRIAIVPQDKKGWNVARAIGVIRLVNPKDARWVKVCLEQGEIQHEIASKANTTVQHTFNLADLQEVSIPFPNEEVRRKILALITPLDDKIELNRQMNRTLEQMARALFKSWFVDFDPVRARTRGEVPEGMDTETAALFPTATEEVEGREVPRGWSIRGLDGIANFLNGLALQKFPPTGQDDLPIVKIAQLRRGNTEGSGFASRDVGRKYTVQDGDILFSWSASLEVVRWVGGEGALNQHLFKVTSDSYSNWFVYYWLLEHLPEFRRIAAHKATTMGHIQRRHLSEAKAIVPSLRLLKKLEPQMHSLFNCMFQNDIENKRLASLRNALLPRLLSGQSDVSGWN